MERGCQAAPANQTDDGHCSKCPSAADGCGVSKLSGAFFSCAGLGHGKNRGEQCGAGGAAKLKARVENGIAVRLEFGGDFRQAAGHNVRVTHGIEQAENEIESSQQHRRKPH